MKYNRIIAILAIAGVLACGEECQAQADSNVYNERVVVTSRYKPVVEERTKVNVAPTITDTVATMPKNFTYEFTESWMTYADGSQMQGQAAYAEITGRHEEALSLDQFAERHA